MPEEAVAFAAEIVAGLRCLLGGPAGGRIAGLGVAMPYNLGSWQRELDIPLAAYRLERVRPRAALAEATGLEVFCENDGTAAAVAELFQGQDRTLDDFLYVFIGAALGGGVVLGGDYHRGANANAGDLGLMPAGPSRLATAPRPSGRPEIAADPRLGQLADPPPARPAASRSTAGASWTPRSSGPPAGGRVAGGRRRRAGRAAAVRRAGARRGGRGLDGNLPRPVLDRADRAAEPRRWPRPRPEAARRRRAWCAARSGATRRRSAPPSCRCTLNFSSSRTILLANERPGGRRARREARACDRAPGRRRSRCATISQDLPGREGARTTCSSRPGAARCRR